MESASRQQNEERLHQIELRRQIEVLKAQLVDVPDLDVSPKRKEPVLLAPATPSPRKKRKLHHSPARPIKPLAPTTNTREKPVPAKPAPSNVVSKLASITRKPESEEPTLIRSSGFTEPAAKRDGNLALLEDFEVGPVDHKPPVDDPNFNHIEPNSGIRLSSRCMPHEDLQEYLTGRYYISPSRLYSAVRPLPSKQGYDVPVDGDWVTIAVVAERSPVKYTKAPVTLEAEKDELKKPKKKDEENPPKPSGKKFVNLKLVDFGSRSQSSATGGKAVIRGDALLTLLVFESDGFDLVKREEGKKPKKVYKGGSRGAFEQISKWKEGDVVALLNPKILKPFQRSADQPHPQNNILAVTPESAGSIVVIGRSKDLGMCEVERKDGKLCRAWVDKRVGEVCEYHIQTAVQRQRSSRAEFSVGTSGMSSTAIHKRKSSYDPRRQWGLKPETPHPSEGGGGATYHFSGHIAKTDAWTSEQIGREGQAKAQRKQTARDNDRALQALLKQDKQGMKAVMMAREAAAVVAASSSSDKKRKSEETEEPVRKGYSAKVIKDLGFDPAAIKSGPSSGPSREAATKKKMEALAAIHANRGEIHLGPRPGPKIRSGVSAPTRQEEHEEVKMVDLDSD